MPDQPNHFIWIFYESEYIQKYSNGIDWMDFKVKVNVGWQLTIGALSPQLKYLYDIICIVYEQLH